MRTINTNTRRYCRAQAHHVIKQLLDGSRWFDVDPCPFDTYQITVKPEVKLPEPMGHRGMLFEQWLVNLQNVVGAQNPLSEEDREAYYDYFVAGMSPGAAYTQAQIDAGRKARAA